MSLLPLKRPTCSHCTQPRSVCYCSHLKPFDSKLKFAILIHPKEAKRRVASGRMSHLSLLDSELIVGDDYTHNHRVNELICDRRYRPFVLYPKNTAIDIDHLSEHQYRDFSAAETKPLIFVIDGTWATARKTMRLSENLNSLQRISFTPPSPSQWKIRKQPEEYCYSTLEAIHRTIELLGPLRGFDKKNREHDQLLSVFERMIEMQLRYYTPA